MAAVQTQVLASENWDDDFEFQPEGGAKSELRPQRPTTLTVVNDTRKFSIASSTGLEDWDVDEEKEPVSHNATENWDEDFVDSNKNNNKVVGIAAQTDGVWDDDGEDSADDDSAEFGKEEDRTVTAKSRRAALKRLSTSSYSLSPTSPLSPPLPPIFFQNGYHQPFPPRSPTSSVFSVPTTNQTYDHYYSSTTHLRPTSAFALLPPSPPIYKERERRRLRKKSRPKPRGTFELASFSNAGRDPSPGPSYLNSKRYSFSDDGDAEPSTSEQSRALPDILRLKAGTPTDTSLSTDERRAVTPSLTALSQPQTPVKGSALLSRIGSVKKWGARRKRASTTPSAVVADESNNDVNRTPRVKSSRGSFHSNIPSARNSISTTPPPQEFSSNPQPNQHHTGNTSSNWFFRASSAGTPPFGAGGRMGGGGNNKSRMGKERDDDDGGADDSRSRRRSGGILNRTRSQNSRNGRVTLNGTKTDSDAHNHLTTPGKLVKRKSLGFIHLRMAVGASKEEIDEKHSPRKERYGGIGIGRVTTARGTGDEGGDDGETEGTHQSDERQDRRSRQKSFSRFLFDRDKESGSNSSLQGEKEKDGSRGFMGSVRRISLVNVGKHKRSKSGNGITGGGGKVPPLPSSTLLQNVKTPSGHLPYSLPPLPTVTNSSQLSLLRLPYGPSASRKQRASQSSSMQDIPSSLRTVSNESNQSQPSTASSSAFPPSSVSGSSHSTRNLIGSSSPREMMTMVQQTTPRPLKRTTSTRSRTSQESGRQRKSISSTTTTRRSLDVKPGKDVSFLVQLSQSGVKSKGEEDYIVPLPRVKSVLGNSTTLVSSDGAPLSLPPLPPPPPLLPPIELQPPSPPQTLTKATKLIPSSPRLPSSSLASNTFIATLDSSSALRLSPSASASSSSSVFLTPSSSPQQQQHSPSSAGATPNSKTSARLHVQPISPKGTPLLQQSASLGRATTAVSGSSKNRDGESGNGGSGSGVTGGGSPQPRRNSLGDLKIPARISQAQVGLRRELGMVREFANNIEQLKDLQRTYDDLVIKIHSVLDANVSRQRLRYQKKELQAKKVNPAGGGGGPHAIGFLPLNRSRSNTVSSSNQEGSAVVTSGPDDDDEVASVLCAINLKYSTTWECADLLIELGGGSGVNEEMTPPPLPSSISAPAASPFQSTPGLEGMTRDRERTLVGGGNDDDEPTIVQPALVSSSETAGMTNDSERGLPSSSSEPSVLPNGPPSWRTSTGRHDLSHRQLVLLREMLNNGDAHSKVAIESTSQVEATSTTTTLVERSIPTSWFQTRQPLSEVNVNTEWKWGDPKNSTVTLPEDMDHFEDAERASVNIKRRSGRLGMNGLRDMLRALKRGAMTEGTASPPLISGIPFHSTTSLSTQSSALSKRLRKPRQSSQQRRITPRTGPDSVRSASENATSELKTAVVYSSTKPRRPSLASIFRIGNNKQRPVANVSSHEVPGSGDNGVPGGTAVEDQSSVEEDWDRMDSTSDLDTAANGSATVRGDRQSGGDGKKKRGKRSPYLQPAAAASSIRGNSKENSVGELLLESAAPRQIRLSNVEEHVDDGGHPASENNNSIQPQSDAQPVRPHRFVGVVNNNKTVDRSGSVRSVLAHSVASSLPGGGGGTISPKELRKPRLAMTPENIKPLLENAKEVQARLGDCIAELRNLLSNIGELDVEPRA